MNIAYGHELARNNYQDIMITGTERLRSVYIAGSSGSGKSSLLQTMIAQDCEDGTGFAVFCVENRLIDPTMQSLVDAGREPLVIDPTRRDPVVPMNVLAVPPDIHRYTVVEGVLQAFRRGWPDAWGPRLEDLLRHACLLLIEPKTTARNPFRKE